MIAGGFDDISEEGSYEFANMKATSNADTEFAMGREPTEMSRPATTSRAGVSSLMFCYNRLLIRVLVHGGSRNRRPYCHECEDRTRTWLSYPWNSGIHFYVNVSYFKAIYSTTLLTPYSDKAGRSVPAPGKGALTVAREVPSNRPLPILD